jgi:hypothetical protein
MVTHNSVLTPVSVGDNAVDLVQKLPRLLPTIKTLQFKTYSVLPALDERLGSEDPSTRKILERTAELKRITENVIPYWELVFATSWDTDKSDLFIKEALKHNSKDEAIERFELKTDDSMIDILSEKIGGVSEDVAVALCSKCITKDGSISHIPMMDFRCKPNESTQEKLKMALYHMGLKSGAILQSGRSYHFYGFELMAEEEWIRYLAKCLLLAPVADSRYIAHRLIEGVGSLRITTCQSKPDAPVIVDLL